MTWYALAIAVLLSSLSAVASPEKCAQIYYDKVPGGKKEFTYGREMSQFIQNLLGHFPNVQQYVIPVEKYERGQIERCATSFYIGVFYDNPIPAAFLEDFAATKKNAVWIGYNVWELGAERLAKIWKARYAGMGKPDWKHLDKKRRPAFFKNYDYKGETFVKFSAVGSDGAFYGAADLVLLDRTEGASDDEVVSWARHSYSNEHRPYVLKVDKHWYVADLPFSYNYEEDRYFIFADTLFDMLEEPPLYPDKRPAIVRFEDMHALIPHWQFEAMLKAAKNTSIAFNVSLIPHFKDPPGNLASAEEQKDVTLDHAPAAFVADLKEAAKAGSILMHGVTHQSDELKNPLGTSAADFEFWVGKKNAPMPEDSPKWVVERLEHGVTLMENAGLKPAAWVTPHYASSSLDAVLFAELFQWQVGRMNFQPFHATQKTKLPLELTFDRSGKEQNGKRLKYLEDLKVENEPATEITGQFLPYEVYGDVYGTRMIPENAGYLRPGPEDGEGAWYVEDVLRVLKRNRVLRDVWGSFFIHPFLVGKKQDGGLGDFNGDSKPLERLFAEAKLLGYEFVAVGEWAKTHTKAIRPEPIEVY